MEKMTYKTGKDILKRAQEAIGIPLKDIDKKGRLATGKGAIGTVIEESWFGYAPNSDDEPDFPEAGIELKVTPYVRNKRGDVSAKERLVCNIINYMEDHDKVFSTSSFWHKCERMVLMSYEHHDDLDKGDFTIDKAILFSFPKEDLIVIEKDWKIIIDKVRAGKAHEISEGDTMYLAACTKGASSRSMREQPFSDIPAKQRAYSLKTSYMTYVLNNYIFGDKKDVNIIKDWHELETQSFEDYIISKVRPYYGMTRSQLKALFGINSDPKNLNYMLISKILKIDTDITKTAEFKKACIRPKTIRVEANGNIKESISFPCIDFLKLVKEDEWEESQLYNLLSPSRFMFIIFQKKDDEYVLKKVMFWNMPDDDLEEIRKVWKRTKDIVKAGVVFTQTKRGVENDLPKKSESRVAHVRPHAEKGKVSSLPDGRTITKQSFWLNNTYIESVIEDEIDQ